MSYTKIQSLRETNLTIQPIIQTIPNYRSFFYTFQTASPIELGRLQKDYIESTECIKDGYVLLTYDAMRRTQCVSFLKSIKRMTDMYLHLMAGIQLLNANRVVHLNIKFDATVFVANNSLPLLGGFEYYSAIMADYVSVDKMLERPIECRAIRYLLVHKLASLSITNIQDICFDEEDNDDAQQDQQDQQFLTTFINMPLKQLITSLLSYSGTWNVFSLNELFLKLLHRDTPNVFVSKWKQCLLKGVSNNPRERGCPSDYIAETRALMYSADLADLAMGASPLGSG